MTPGRAFSHLVGIMRRLRSPGGCPWDREQTASSLTKFIIEECYELVEAIERGRVEDVREELGDLLLLVVFEAELAQERGQFDIGAVLEGIVGKLRRRHPHVFGERRVGSAAEVLDLWHGLKMEEKKEGLRAVPVGLPALARAQAVQAAASRVGFDWPDEKGPKEKVAAEMEELQAALRAGDGERIKEEAGDLLFSVVNLCRLLGVEAETALRLTVRKFEERMRWMEKVAEEGGKTLLGMSLEEMDALWEKSKVRTSKQNTGVRSQESGNRQ